MPLSRVIVIGRPISFDKDTTPRGMQVLNVRIQDSTGTCKVMVYYREHFEKLCRKGDYLKVSVTAKCGGLVYRPEIKLVCHSMVALDNFDELTEHCLECMKTELSS